jgi:hypothetical protein
MTPADSIPTTLDDSAPVPKLRLRPSNAVAILTLRTGLSGLVMVADGRIDVAISLVLVKAA